MAAIASLGLAAGRAVADAPPGATAVCNDGSYSYSHTRSGTCSHHGGVAVWLTSVATTPATTTGVVTMSPTTTAAATMSATTAVAAPTSTAPLGATARCNDGTYSFSKTHSGTCSHHGGVAAWLDGSGGTKAGGNGGGVSTVGATVLLAPRIASSGCVRGARPDRRCSPGAYYAGLNTRVICASSFRTGSIRNVPQAEKYAVEREYGMRAALYGRSIEIDHIVSLELGGSNDIANLFPEPGTGAASYHAKDKLENRLHVMVCGGQITLRQAQTQIASNWEALYQREYGVFPRR